MLDKATFITSLKHEVKIITHLAAQLTSAQLDYRPTPGQRSTLELLRYLTIMGTGTVGYSFSGNWDHWADLEQQGAGVELASFAKAMARQHKGIVKALAGHTDAKLRRQRVKTFAGIETTLGHGLVEMVLKPFAAYRMQLFLYAKAAGLSQLGFTDVWAGRAPKPAKKSAKKSAAG